MSDADNAAYELVKKGLKADKEHFEAALKDADSELITLFIEAGVNPELSDENGYTPLMNAIMYGNLEAVKTLLNYNVRLNPENRYGKDALMMAVISGNNDAVELLLDKKADPDTSSDTGETPLSLAVKARNKEIITTLLKKGASPAFKTSRESPLDLARKIGDKDILELLFTVSKEEDAEEPKEEEKVKSRKNPADHKEFHAAIAKGEVDKVKDWLNQGQNPDIVTELGYTPLMTAISYDQHEIVEELLAKKPRINQQNRNGYTALHVAVICNNAKAVKKLLDAGINKEVENMSGETALLTSMIFLNRDVVKYLLDAGANPNHKNHGGYNAISMAVMKKSQRIVEMLLENGADPNTVVQGETPLQRSERLGFSEITEIIKKHV